MVVSICDFLEKPEGQDCLPAASLTPEDLEERRVRNLRDLGPVWLNSQLQKPKFLKALTAKELFGYMAIFYPFILDEGTVPFGSGGIKGFTMVRHGASYLEAKGPDGKTVKEVDAQIGTKSLISQISSESACRLQGAVRASIAALPEAVQQLPGYQWQLRLSSGICSLDAEFCFSWFKSFLKNNHGPSSSWTGFKRSAWRRLGTCVRD